MIFGMKKLWLYFGWMVLINGQLLAQEEDENFFHRKDQSDSIMTVQESIYNRPFITMGNIQTAIGGYVEGNTNYFKEDGISEGFSMELRRFNIFLYSTIIPRVRFISELEFEHGTEEIELETALIDFELNPAFVIRAGILLPPIGRFNQNHDSPQWEIIDRPFVSTQIIPSTLSEVGFGANGKFFKGQMIFTYDLYLVNGLGSGIVDNEFGRTDIQSGKNGERFAEDENGRPMLTGRIGLRHRKWGEIGISGHGGTYNIFELEGTKVAPKNKLSIFAVDFSLQIAKATVQGEYALANIDIAQDASEQFGDKQWGGFAEVIYPVLKRQILGFPNSVINATVRLEKIDYNKGEFNNEDGLLDDLNIYDDLSAIVLGLGFRPSAGTIMRANYRYHWTRDFLGNPTIKTAGFQVGFATYF